jgi:hypothetical protein
MIEKEGFPFFPSFNFCVYGKKEKKFIRNGFIYIEKLINEVNKKYFISYIK